MIIIIYIVKLKWIKSLKIDEKNALAKLSINIEILCVEDMRMMLK